MNNTMKYELKRIGVWSAIKVGVFLWGLIGFLSGIYVALMMPLLIDMMDGLGSMSGGMQDFGPIMLFVLPIMYSIIAVVLGTILTIILTSFFNLLCRLFGGIELELKEEAIQPLNLPESFNGSLQRDEDIPD